MFKIDDPHQSLTYIQMLQQKFNSFKLMIQGIKKYVKLLLEVLHV